MLADGQLDLRQAITAVGGHNRTPEAEPGGLLQAARQIRDRVDRVIVLEDGSGGLAARAIFESCAHPCHNDLSRGERGGRPRLVFLGPDLDNDSLQGLLDVVSPAGKPRGSDLLDRLLDRARIGGTLMLRGLPGPLQDPFIARDSWVRSSRFCTN